MSADTFWTALALALLMEGLLPFAAPGAWRRIFSQILNLGDGQIRFFGLFSMLLGLLLLWALGS